MASAGTRKPKKVKTEQNTPKTSALSVVELAQKKRHLHLLERMHQGKPLSRRELEELKAFEAQQKAPADGIARNIPELARALGVATTTVRYWKYEGIPRRADGLYDVEVVRAWRKTRDNRRTAKPASAVDEAVQQERVRKLKIANDREMGLLVPRDDVQRAAFECARRTRDALLSIPDRCCDLLASLTDGDAVRTVLTKELTQALEALADGQATD